MKSYPTKTPINPVTLTRRQWTASAAALALTACGGGGGGDAPAGDTATTGQTTSLAGTMYYIFAGNLKKIDLSSGKVTQLGGREDRATIPGFLQSTIFDVSIDGKEVMLLIEPAISEPGWYDDVYFNLVSSSNLLQVNSRYKINRDTVSGEAKLSPDKSKIATKWLNPSPRGDKPIQSIFVRRRTGEVIIRYDRDGSANDIDEMAWMPDGNLLLVTPLGVSKTTDTTLLNAKFLFKPSLPSWNSIAVSPDGTRLALKSDRHIYTMNIDGSKLVQVTDSDNKDNELKPEWSPDGKYLVFEASVFSYGSTGGGSIEQLIVVPADNKTYKISKEYFEITSGANIFGGGSSIKASNGILILRSSDNQNVFGGGVVWR
jgi:WD40-like Beta Propeller Repeat